MQLRLPPDMPPEERQAADRQLAADAVKLVNAALPDGCRADGAPRLSPREILAACKRSSRASCQPPAHSRRQWLPLGTRASGMAKVCATLQCAIVRLSMPHLQALTAIADCSYSRCRLDRTVGSQCSLFFCVQTPAHMPGCVHAGPATSPIGGGWTSSPTLLRRCFWSTPARGCARPLTLHSSPACLRRFARPANVHCLANLYCIDVKQPQAALAVLLPADPTYVTPQARGIGTDIHQSYLD